MKKVFKTERDTALYFVLVWLLIYVFLLFLWFIEKIHVDITIFIGISCVFLLLALPYFLFWFTLWLKKKRAFKFGEKYEGFVSHIEFVRNAEKLHSMNNRTLPRCEVTYINNRRKHKCYTETFINMDKGDFPLWHKCDVYLYGGKAYFKNEFWESDSSEYDRYNRLFEVSISEISEVSNDVFKIALEEREEMPAKKSNECILMPAIMIYLKERTSYIFVEPHISGLKEYTYEDLNIYKSLCEYVRQNANKYFDGNSAGYIYDIKNYVIESCKTTLPQLKVEEVLVAIRDVK